MKRKFFVYGTLREGEKYSGIIDPHVVMRRVVRLEGFRLFDDGRGYPLMVEGGEGDSVVGEVVVVDDPDGRVLAAVDRLEDAGEDIPVEERLYRRVLVEVDGEEVWTYLYNGDPPPGARQITDWVREGRK
ncbi:MAG: gamma-glutamylcyclotransferase [Deltaproteobacteria bacterium]|nr:MAG: gamma-glutamylcyclotransferase [Deltaproteobacteria bacterium]